MKNDGKRQCLALRLAVLWALFFPLVDSVARVFDVISTGDHYKITTSVAFLFMLMWLGPVWILWKEYKRGD
jgi:hypothetical protein